MTMPQENIVSEMESLIALCRDGQAGYQDAARDVQDAELRSLFEDYAKQRAAFAQALGTTLVSFTRSVKPAQGTLAGTLHRGWLNLRQLLTGHDRHAILRECQRGEEAAASAYEKALQMHLPADVRAVVVRQSQAIHASLEKVKALAAVEERRAKAQP